MAAILVVLMVAVVFFADWLFSRYRRRSSMTVDLLSSYRNVYQGHLLMQDGGTPIRSEESQERKKKLKMFRKKTEEKKFKVGDLVRHRASDNIGVVVKVGIFSGRCLVSSDFGIETVESRESLELDNEV